MENNRIDVREVMIESEPVNVEGIRGDVERFITSELSDAPRYSYDDACARLKYIRNLRTDFRRFFNQHNGSMSPKCQKAYDSLYDILQKFDDMELENIKHGM